MVCSTICVVLAPQVTQRLLSVISLFGLSLSLSHPLSCYLVVLRLVASCTLASALTDYGAHGEILAHISFSCIQLFGLSPLRVDARTASCARSSLVSNTYLLAKTMQNARMLLCPEGWDGQLTLHSHGSLPLSDLFRA